jgi:hypothetical protein
VAYELTAEPQLMALCHCRDCRHVTGGEPAAVAIAPAGSFRLTQGEMKAYWREGASGNSADRNFCPECGTHLVSRLHSGPFVAVMVGNLDEPLGLAPQMEVWTASALPWAHRPDGAQRFEQNAG